METPPPHINNFGGRLVDSPFDSSRLDPVDKKVFARGYPIAKSRFSLDGVSGGFKPLATAWSSTGVMYKETKF